MIKNKSIVLSIHDVCPDTFQSTVKVDSYYHKIGVGNRYAMLVVPNYHNGGHFSEYPAFLEWLTEKAHGGVEIILHGYYHLDQRLLHERGMVDRVKQLLAGEGEFLSMDILQARKLITKGKQELQKYLGIPIRSFIAPAWHYSPATRQVLTELEFQVAEDRMSVWSPASSNSVITRAPVIAYSSRNWMKVGSSLLWSRVADKVLRFCPVVRHALHPPDFDSPVLEKEITRSLKGLLEYRTIIRYQDLVNNQST